MPNQLLRTKALVSGQLSCQSKNQHNETITSLNVWSASNFPKLSARIFTKHIHNKSVTKTYRPIDQLRQRVSQWDHLVKIWWLETESV